MTNTPADDGFIMPAEWEEHEGTWLHWPNNSTYQFHQMRIELSWFAMTKALHEHEMVHIAVWDKYQQEELYKRLSGFGFDMSNIDLQVIPTQDVWARDYGGIFLKNDGGELAVTSWNFNGYGRRFTYDIDGHVASRVAEKLSLPLYTAPITLEGGGIEVNGKGTFMGTRSCIMNDNRNPGLTQERAEEVLRQYLGVTSFIWLSGAPTEDCLKVNDDTDFHIDGAAKFINEDTVMYTPAEDESDLFYPYLKRHVEELKAARTESGKPLNMIALPGTANPIFSTLNCSYPHQVGYVSQQYETAPLLGDYLNFYIANNVVLVPAYGDKNDALARQIIAEHFPGRIVVPITANPIAEHNGVIHCVTQQQPATSGIGF